MDRTPTARSWRTTTAFRSLRLPVIALGLGLMITACNASGNASTRAPTAPPVVLHEVLDVMLREPFEGAAEAYLASLPPATSSESRTVTNAYDPRLRDVIETLTYDGLSITVYHVSATGKRFPVEVSVSAPDHRTTDGLRVGLTRAEVRDRLGDPTTVSTDTGAVQPATLALWHYVRVEEGATPYGLDIRFQDDSVTELRWTVQVE